MSVIRRDTRTLGRSPARAAGTLAVRWAVSARVPGSRLSIPDTDEVPVELAIEPLDPDRSGHRCLAVLRALPAGRPAFELRRAELAARCTYDATLSAWHIDAPGAFSITASGLDDGSPQLWYARLDWIAHLGLPGGRYEPEGIAGRWPTP